MNLVHDKTNKNTYSAHLDIISKPKSLIFLLECLCQWCFRTPGLCRVWQWWTSFVLNRSESSKMHIIILSCTANFKQTVWQSCSVGALFQRLASLNTFHMEIWEAFPSIASKQLSVHHFNRPEVSSCGGSQKNGMLACGRILGFQLAGVHPCNRLLIEPCSCDFTTRHVSLCVRTIVEVFT